MLKHHENKFKAQEAIDSAITNQNWRDKVALYQINVLNYTSFRIWKKDNQLVTDFKPSDLFRQGSYPFS
jgi:hypothetical protein